MTIETFCSRLTQECHVIEGSHVLVAVSGGADSVALLCLLEEAAKRLALRISCAHVEHGIRGEESRADEDFVRSLCEQKGFECHVGRMDVPGYALSHRCGIEEAARTLRYAFLERTAEEIGADVVALAHHAGDQAETVLLHAARGSDMHGLCAMRYRRGCYIRPLLDCFPEELREMLIRQKQDWREDSTNANLNYARNRIRNRILPELEQTYQGAKQALVRLSQAAQRDEDFFEQQLSNLPLPLCLVDGLAYERKVFDSLHLAIQSRLLVRLIEQARIERQRTEVIDQICDASVQGRRGSVNLTQNAHVELGARWLCITRCENAHDEYPLSAKGETRTPFGIFRVRPALPGETGDGIHEQAIPTTLFQGVRISSRRPGDSFLPFGSESRVSLKKVMASSGVERAMRASIPVLRKEDDILWVAGLRPSMLCKVKNGEESVIVSYSGLQSF